MYDVNKAIVRNKFHCLVFSLIVEIKTLMPFELGSVMDEWINPLLRNVVKWSDAFYKSCGKCCKIFKMCLTILPHCEVKG